MPLADCCELTGPVRESAPINTKPYAITFMVLPFYVRGECAEASRVGANVELNYLAWAHLQPEMTEAEDQSAEKQTPVLPRTVDSRIAKKKAS